MGRVVMAYVVLKPGKTLSADELIAYCRHLLANYKIPRRVEFSGTEATKERLRQNTEEGLRERF